MTPGLETARLLLLPLRLEDAEQVQPLFGQWEIVRDLAAFVPWPYPADGSYTFYRDIALPAVERGEQWHWTLRLKSDPGRIIGAVSLQLGDTNRGFWVAREFQGRGLATEATEAVTEYWFDVLDQPVLRTYKAVRNAASSRVSAKTGMRMTGLRDMDSVSGVQPSELWEITAAEWRSHRARTVKSEEAGRAGEDRGALPVSDEPAGSD